MMPGGNFVPLFGNLFGTGKGAGMAILYVISSVILFLIGFSGFFVPRLRKVETIVPDYDIENDYCVIYLLLKLVSSYNCHSLSAIGTTFEFPFTRHSHMIII